MLERISAVSRNKNYYGSNPMCKNVADKTSNSNNPMKIDCHYPNNKISKTTIPWFVPIINKSMTSIIRYYHRSAVSRSSRFMPGTRVPFEPMPNIKWYSSKWSRRHRTRIKQSRDDDGPAAVAASVGRNVGYDPRQFWSRNFDNLSLGTASPLLGGSKVVISLDICRDSMLSVINLNDD